MPKVDEGSLHDFGCGCVIIAFVTWMILGSLYGSAIARWLYDRWSSGG